MPMPSSQMNSGATSTWCGPSAGRTPKMTRTPTVLTSGPPTSPHQARPVHQPPEDEAVPDAGEDARPDPERPLIDREDALPNRGVGPTRRVLAEAGDGEHADDAERDEGALHQARRHVSDGARFVHALVDRVRHH